MSRSLWLVLFLMSSLMSWGTSGLKITGKIRVLQPTTIRLENIRGEVILTTKVGTDGLISMGPAEIQPDLYRLRIGQNMVKALYLENNTIEIKGFWNEKNPESSTLNFSGINAHQALVEWLPEKTSPEKREVRQEALEALRPGQLGALAYLADMMNYESNAMLLKRIPPEERNSLAAQWLMHRVDSLKPYALGSEAYDFAFVDPAGKRVRLSDFRGKFVLVDFWASWCGPCRQEMKSLLPIYQELKCDELEFISVSLDSREKDWRKMLEEENLPWVMLWDREGFKKGNEPTAIQKAYGFYGIPFIVLIDREGKILQRDLRGQQVRETLLNVLINN